MTTIETARLIAVRSLAASLLGLPASLAFAQAPAAKLMPAQTVTPVGGAVLSRAAAPDFTAFDPNKPVAPSFVPSSSDPAPKSGGWFSGPPSNPSNSTAKPLINWWTPPPTQPLPAPMPKPELSPTPMAPVPSGTESKSLIGEAWTGVKELVVGKPMPGQQPFVRPGDPAPARTGPPQTPSANTGIYASPPAYRWYGWGTTTPGANPHAPTGYYPNGSANWLSQTGATPGAFPAPAVARRESPGWEPPAYARVPAGLVESPSLAVNSPVSTWQTAPIPAPSMPAMIPSPNLPTTANAGGVNWQPAGATASSFGPISSRPQPFVNPPAPAVNTIVFRAQAPQAPATVEELVKDAAKGWAIVEHVKSTEANKLSVLLVTSTEADARKAAEAISRVPQLRPYEIRFEARVK